MYFFLTNVKSTKNNFPRNQKENGQNCPKKIIFLKSNIYYHYKSLPLLPRPPNYNKK